MGKEREREESKKGAYGLEIAVRTQNMHELVIKCSSSDLFLQLRDTCLRPSTDGHPQKRLLCHLKKQRFSPGGERV